MALNFPDSPTLNQVYTDSTSGFSYRWNGTVWISYEPSTTNNIRELDDISASFNGSTTIFPLTIGSQSVSPASTNQLIISVGGVMQNPTDDFYISGTNIVFTTAPENGLTFFGTLLGTAVPIGVSTIGDVYNRQTYSVTGVQTDFSFPSGYTVGYLDVFRNGSRLISGNDFTATTGNSFTLSPPAQNGDDVEAIGYKVSTIAVTEGNLVDLIVNQNATVLGITTLGTSVGAGQTVLFVEGNARVTGILTVGTSSITLDGSNNEIKIGAGITISSTGITGSASTVTSSSVSYGLSGTPNIVVGFTTVGTALSLSGYYVENITAVAALDIDCSTSNYFTKTIDGDSVFTFSNVPSGGAYSFTLELTHTSGTVTWPETVKWPADTAPTLTTGKTHLFIFVTKNSGTTWRGSSLVDYVN